MAAQDDGAAPLFAKRGATGLAGAVRQALLRAVQTVEATPIAGGRDHAAELSGIVKQLGQQQRARPCAAWSPACASSLAHPDTCPRRAEIPLAAKSGVVKSTLCNALVHAALPDSDEYAGCVLEDDAVHGAPARQATYVDTALKDPWTVPLPALLLTEVTTDAEVELYSQATSCTSMRPRRSCAWCTTTWTMRTCR